MRMKQMTDSLTPWDYGQQKREETDSSKKLRIKKSKSKKEVCFSTGLSQRLKPNTRQCPRSHYSIKLQERVPTEVVEIDAKKWEVQIKPLTIFKDQLILKIPNNFLTLPIKNSTQRPIKHAVNSFRNPTNLNHQKVSFRNFQQQIQQLDKFKLSKKMRIDIKRGISQSSASIRNKKIFDPVKKCALKNIFIYEQRKEERQIKHKKIFQIESKKHFLDRILSRFQ